LVIGTLKSLDSFLCKINKYKLIAGLGVVLPWDPIPIV